MGADSGFDGENIGDTRCTPGAAEEEKGRVAWAGRELSFIAAFAKEQDRF
jgi:hypothetical protein